MSQTPRPHRLRTPPKHKEAKAHRALERKPRPMPSPTLAQLLALARAMELVQQGKQPSLVLRRGPGGGLFAQFGQSASVGDISIDDGPIATGETLAEAVVNLVGL